MATPKEKPIEDLYSLVPRVSVLERGQEAIQRDLITLSHAVKDQGLQLTSALTKLTEVHHSSFNILNEKISSTGKTDWQSFWTMAGTLIVIVAAIMSPVWMQFNQVEKNFSNMNEQLSEIKTTQIENLRNIAVIKAQYDASEKYHEKNIHHNTGS